MSAHDNQMIVQKLNRILQLYKDNQKIRFPSDNGHKEKCLSKVERVLLAGFLLTEHVSAQEPLVAAFHERLFDLYDHVAHFLQKRQPHLFDELVFDLRRQSMLTDLLFLKGAISEQNARVFTAALRELHLLLVEPKEEQSADALGYLDRLFPHLAFGQGALSADSSAANQHTQNQALHPTTKQKLSTTTFADNTLQTSPAEEQGAGNDLLNVSSPEKVVDAPGSSPKPTHQVLETSQPAVSETVVQSPSSPETTPKTGRKKVSLKAKAKSANRRILILNVLAKKTVATIKEIAAEIPDVSLKTLQRELQKLVADGIIEKQGEKRWTQYRLL